MTPIQLSELIGLIYETASDESLWPQLLEKTAAYLSATSSTTRNALVASFSSATDADGFTDMQMLMASLAPHFARAQAMHREHMDTEIERDAAHDILDRLPLGIATISREGSIIHLNRSMRALIQGSNQLRVIAGRLMSMPPSYLAEAIDSIFSSNGGDRHVKLKDPRHGNALSLMLTLKSDSTHVTILAASQSSQALSESGLCSLYGLTPAEAKVTQHLAFGDTVDEAAQKLAIKMSTARTHVQRVLGKVGVSRQADLLRSLFSSPLWLASDSSKQEQLVCITEPSDDNEDVNRSFTLRSGRTIPYSDIGDKTGLPIIMMHAIMASRHMRHSDDGVLIRLGVRLIIPERPGSGDAEPCDDRKIVDWANDIAELADYLGIKHFAVLGYSAGTPYALATASILPRRVLALSVVAAMPPFQEIEDIRDYSVAFRAGLLIGKYTPMLLPSMLRVVNRGVRKSPYRYIEQMLSGAATADKRAMADPKLRARYAAALLAGLNWGDRGLSCEVLLLSRDWGIRFDDVKVDAVFWHGQDDSLVAIAGAKKLVSAIPNSRFHMVPAAGHYVLFSHWEEILRDLKSLSVRPTPGKVEQRSLAPL